jgi:plastocyanin
MTWRWLICFNAISLALAAAPVTGRVELADSRDPAVRKQKNYAGVVLWLEPVGRAAPVPAPGRAQMLQKGKSFLPHVLAIPVGGTVDFPNLDPIFHNAFSNFSGQPFDVGLYAPGTSRSVTFRHPGVVRVFCNIHTTMSAIIAVLKTPWYTVTPASGAFRFESVPPGEYRLRVFHERALPETLTAAERRITVADSPLELPLIPISETGFIPAPHLNKYGKEYPPVTTESLYPGGK